MAVVQTIGFTPTLFTDNGYYEQSSKWGSLSVSTVSPVLDWASPFQGYSLNWGGFDNQTVNNPFFNQPYSGYTTNFNAQDTSGTIDAVTNKNYAGYTTNWGQYSEPINASIEDVDKNSIVDYPKEQIVYYKLKGWNPITEEFEAWVVSHNITARPALDGGIFDPEPGREPPNVERDVWKTPPSGNALVNIVIVARWFQ